MKPKTLPLNLYSARRINEATPGREFDRNLGVSVIYSQATFLLADVLRIEGPDYNLDGTLFNPVEGYDGPLCTVVIKAGTVLQLAEDRSKLLAAFVQFHELEASRIPGLLRN